MPLHKAEPYCLKDKSTKTHDCCSCQHCTLAVCRVCGQYEGGLTQDCPGVKMASGVGALVYEGGLDYSDAKGWFVHAPEDMTPSRKGFRPGPRFEPTAEDIIKRVMKIPLDSRALKYIEDLVKDAEYWLNNREHRR
jgi:hypothetical protein